MKKVALVCLWKKSAIVLLALVLTQAAEVCSITRQNPGTNQMLGLAPARAAELTAPPAMASSRSDDGEAFDVRLLDLELVDQDGNSARFKSDIVGDRIAVIIPFYTSCPSSYPFLVFMLGRVQECLGERLGEEVVLIALTVDPRGDTPQRLKAYARRQKARPGWIFLTGERDNLAQVLLGAGALLSPKLEEHHHIPITLVGSGCGPWKRFHGFPSPARIMQEINRLSAERQKD
jgi:protein SCO1/2